MQGTNKDKKQNKKKPHGESHNQHFFKLLPVM